MTEIRTTNQFCVLIMGKNVAIAKGKSVLSVDEALNMSAWLRTVAECLAPDSEEVEKKFQHILSVIKDPNVRSVKGMKKNE